MMRLGEVADSHNDKFLIQVIPCSLTPDQVGPHSAHPERHAQQLDLPHRQKGHPGLETVRTAHSEGRPRTTARLHWVAQTYELKHVPQIRVR